MKIEYIVELKEGYRPVMQEEEENIIKFEVEAKNFATAQRMVKAMLKGAENIADIVPVCFE